jgi:hypothetical protein
MALSTLELVSQLERDIAAFYIRLKNLAGYLRSDDTIDSMIRESMEHAERVDMLAKKYDKPEIKHHIVRELHEQIMSALVTEIGSSRSMRIGIEKIAHTEEQVGKLYQFIAGYYEKLALYYTNIAEEMKVIAKEEFDHRDRVMGEIDKY